MGGQREPVVTAERIAATVAHALHGQPVVGRRPRWLSAHDVDGGIVMGHVEGGDAPATPWHAVIVLGAPPGMESTR